MQLDLLSKDQQAIKEDLDKIFDETTDQNQQIQPQIIGKITKIFDSLFAEKLCLDSCQNDQIKQNFSLKKLVYEDQPAQIAKLLEMKNQPSQQI